MVSFNATIVVQIINFFVLFLLLDRLFFRKLVKVMGERRQFIETAERQVADQLAELTRMQTDYQKQLEAARQEAQTAIHGQLATAEAEKTQILSAVHTEVDAQLTAMRQEITAQRAQAETELRQEITTLAGQIADKAMQVARQPVLR